jgi:hypothetical protein
MMIMIMIIIIRIITIQLYIIYVLTQQSQGQLYSQHRYIRKLQKYKQQMKTHTKEVIKITPKNYSINHTVSKKNLRN